MHTPPLAHARHITLIATIMLTCACATGDIDDRDGPGETIRVEPPGPGSGDMTPDQRDDLDQTPDADLDDMTPDADPDDMTPDVVPDDMPLDVVPDMMTEPDMATEPDMTTEPDLPPTPTCDTTLTLNTTLRIDNAEPGQYHGRAAFDGEGIWIAYLRPESAQVRDFRVFATRLGCDGAVLIPPFQVGPSGRKDRDVSVAAGPESVFITWTSELDGANSTFARAFSPDGTPRAAAAEITPLNAQGQPLSALVWESDATASPTQDHAILAATYFDLDGATFQIAAQRFDSAGMRIGDAMIVRREKFVQHERPSIAALADGTLYVSWTRSRDADPSTGVAAEPKRVVYNRFLPGQTTPDPTGPFPAQPGSNAVHELSRYSRPDAQGRLAIAFQSTSNNNVFVRQGTFNAPTTVSEFGNNSAYDSRPIAALGPNGGLVAWMRGASPAADLYIQPLNAQLTRTGSASRLISSGQVRAFNTAGPDLVHLENGAYLVLWSEGSTPQNATLRARMVRP